jgi:hypothetical protein
MTPKIRKLIAQLEIAAGLYAIAVYIAAYVVTPSARPVVTPDVIFTVVMGAAAVGAGALLWWGSPAGLTLSRALQALQVPVLNTPWIAYQAFLGLRLVPGFAGWNVSFSMAWGGFAALHWHPQAPDGLIGINLVPLVFLWLLRSPREGALSTTEVAPA